MHARPAARACGTYLRDPRMLQPANHIRSRSCSPRAGSPASSPAQPLEGKPSSEASEDWVQLRNPDGRIFHHNPTTGALHAHRACLRWRFGEMQWENDWPAPTAHSPHLRFRAGESRWSPE